MKLAHLHAYVRDLEAAKSWFASRMDLSPKFENEQLAYFQTGPVVTVLEKSEEDAKLTLAFDSKDCDATFKQLVIDDSDVIEAPTNRAWGVRSAYISGPGNLTIEIEESL